MRLLLALVGALLLSACATLSEDDCLQGDWQTIGFQDGSRGYLPERIGSHREACAEYGIRPDFDGYMAGHKAGVVRFCTYNKGYSLGRRGGQYNGVCPPAQEMSFLQGFNRGRELYQLDHNIEQIESDIQSLEGEIDSFHQEIADNEQLIVSNKTTPSERRQLLERNHELEHLIDDHAARLDELLSERDILMQHLESLQAQ